MNIRIISLAIWLVSMGVFPALAQDDEAACPELVQVAYESTQTACDATGRDEACYGNTLVSAEPQPDIDDFQFEAPGDIAEVSEIASLRLSSMDVAAEAWGISLIRIQADLPDASDSYVELLLFGNVEIENRGGESADPDAEPYRPMQAFYFTTGTDDSPCEAAPDSGILIQTPEGEGEITLLVNEVVIELGSTAYIQAQPSEDMVVSVVEGEASVTADGTTVVAPAGTLTTVPLDADGAADGPPTEPEPYDETNLAALPTAMLTRPVAVAPASTGSASGGLPTAGTWATTSACSNVPGVGTTEETTATEIIVNGDTFTVIGDTGDPLVFSDDGSGAYVSVFSMADQGVEATAIYTLQVLAPDHVQGTALIESSGEGFAMSVDCTIEMTLTSE